ncbi:MAG: preprotein translocase subunit SecA [Candidatus Taylorbacteria bacterium]|nr:preprotein translocase subunit SecA [Candidatus Taylorbacteria bacterium]
MSFLDKFRGGPTTRGVRKFEPIVPKINALEPAMRALSGADLKAKTAEFKAKLAGKSREEEKEILDAILPEAFAAVREAARRTLGQRHFDVQMIGGMVINSGGIAEMRTGEGKTLVATLPLYLNALSGRGVHLITVNDYLSRRDGTWMGQIFDALGLSVAVVNHEASYIYDPSAKAVPIETEEKLDKERDELGSFKVVHEFLRPCTRHEAYLADITYGTNVEFGFDYLRDNLEYSAAQLRQREFNYCVVDEIDSILIDEARTPLIISAPTRDAEATYKQFASLVTSFMPDVDYTVEEKHHAISLTGAGITKAEKALGIENIYTDSGIKSVHHLETAIRAKALFHKDKEYVVKDNQIIIVDEFTGRLQPGRRWSEGLHQAIEAKEGVAIQQESRTYASITYQNFFRMYPKLSGMTGTAVTSAEEFFKVYGLEVYTVPTNKPMIRLDRNDQIFRTEAGKFKAISRRVKDLHSKGQPVLIGTVSIEKNELLSQFLKSEGIPHTILNAKPEYAEKEGETIAQAGKKGAVTISTNMAGRGVDVKLGGNPNTPESYEEVKNLGGLFILGTERHEARRIDNQLRGRSGRQGDPGETQFFVSLEDQLMRVFASDMLKSMMGKLGMPEDEPIEHKIISRSLESAQEKIEGFNFDSRKNVLEFDDVINHQRATIYGNRRKLLVGSLDDVEAQLNEMIGDGADSVVGGGGDANARAIVDKKIAEFGREPFLAAVRIILLQTIDMYWVEHLEVMDYTRSSVNLRAYGQRDPLVEYKKEGLRLYREMQAAMHGQFVRVLPNIVPVMNSTDGAQNSSKGGGAAGGQAGGKEPGRNDPCPCGSGKKYKKCHMKGN